jgi:hypothetical protein
MYLRWQGRKLQQPSCGDRGVRLRDEKGDYVRNERGTALCTRAATNTLDVRWAAVLVESVRVNGKPRQRHIAYLASITDSRTEIVHHRRCFWDAVQEGLDRQGNAVSPEDRKRIEAAITCKVPRLTVEEHEACVRESVRDTARQFGEDLLPSKLKKRVRGKPRMRKWEGGGFGNLPTERKEDLRRRSCNLLKRHGIPDEVIAQIVDRLVYIVSCAYAGRDHKLVAKGPGPPVAAAANLLSVDVDESLREHDLRGNCLQYGNDQERGRTGLIAELECIAMTAFRQACDEQAEGVEARPARISDARKILGQIHRTKLPDRMVNLGPVFFNTGELT